MKSIEKISPMQVIFIFVINRIIFGISYMPTVNQYPANQDAWIAELLSAIAAFVLTIPLLYIANKFEDNTLQENFEVILGKPIGKILGSVYVLFILIIVTESMLQVVDFLKTVALTDTPMYAILFILLLPCIYGAFKGIENIARASVILGVIIASTIIIFAVANSNHFDFKLFLPILSDSNPASFSLGIFKNASQISYTIAFFMFIPFIQKNQKMNSTKIMMIIVLCMAVINTFIVITTQAVLSPSFAKILRFPYFRSIQQTDLFNFIQRIEFLNVIIWVLVFIIKLTTNILAASLETAQIVNAKSYKPFILPFSVIVYFAILLTGIQSVAKMDLLSSFTPFLTFIFVTVIPALILIVYFIRKKQLKIFISQK